MAAKAWGTADKAVEEIFFQNDAVSLCMLVNRRQKTMRVIDFRAGPSHAKRMFVLSIGQREGMDKVFTLVERDEVATWVKLGFNREGNIPGFYKRSDAFLLGLSFDAVPRLQSEMRIAVRDVQPIDEDEEIAEDPPVDTRAQDLAERTIVQAKRAAKELVGKSLPLIKVAEVKESYVKKPLAVAVRAGRALTSFEPFGRDVERRYYSLTGRGGYELLTSTESQACFGNAYLEMLNAPRNDGERLAVVSALRSMCDRMLAEGIVSCFALAPSDDLALATAFCFNGFRRTGLLHNHIAMGNVRKDAIIWSRKLSLPTDE